MRSIVMSNGKIQGYEIPISECENKERTLFTPVNIIFDLVKHQV